MSDFGDWPVPETDEIEAVTNVLTSGKVNYWSGEEGRNFEKEFSAYVGVPHAVAVANGTLALELALIALDIGDGHDVVVTPRTFIASASAIVLRGARPVFADVDEDSQNITPESVDRVLTPNTRAILLVHLAGWPCDMDGFQALAKERGVLLIEDCAQAHGATWRGKRLGSFGDAAAFSFCTDKIMSTGGEGGMLLLKCERAWRRAWSYKDHGKDWDAVYSYEHPDGFRWLHKSFGSNWRLTEMQSAIGRVQLRKLDKWVEKRRNNAAILYRCLNGIESVRVPWPSSHEGHSFYKFYAFVRPERMRPDWTRDRVVKEITSGGVPCWHGACPEVYLEDAFLDSPYRCLERLAMARELGRTSLMFPVHPTLTEQDTVRVGRVAADVLEEAEG